MKTKHGVARSPLAAKQHNISSSSKTAKSGSTDDTLAKVMAMVDTWLAYRKKLLPAWERDTKLYNNERVEKHYQGVADTFVPMTYSTIEAISAALITADFNTDFVPQDIFKYLKDRLMPGFTGTVFVDGQETQETEEQYLARAIKTAMNGESITDEALEVLNALYDYYWDSGDWELEIGDGIDSGLQIGNGSWWMEFENNRPELMSVPFPDYIFNPVKTDDDSMDFAGRRFLASKKELSEEMIVDPDKKDKDGNPVLKKRYNLSGLKKRESNAKDDNTEKELMEQMLFGSTVEIKDDKGKLKDDIDQCEVIRIMTKERMYTVVNRCCLAEDVENPILAQAKLRGIKDTSRLILIPGITWKNNGRKSLFIGRSETSTFWKEQERLNDATNQKSDSVTRALLQTYRADPSLKSQKNSFGVPGAVIWASAGQYEANVPAQVPSAAFNEEASVKNNIRETTATDQIVKGVGSSEDVTATEARLQVAQSGQRIEKKIKTLERGPLKRVARLAHQYVRLFVTDPFIVPQKANNGITPLLYDPKKYNYDFEPKVTLSVNNQAQKRQDQKTAAEDYKVIISDPTNDLQAAKEEIYPKMFDLDKDQIRRITTNPNPNPLPVADPNLAQASQGAAL